MTASTFDTADTETTPTSLELAARSSLELAALCAKVAEDFRGGDTVVLDLTGVTPIFDYFVITTGASQRQMRALGDEIARTLRDHGSTRLGVEGETSSPWILYDYGDIVLHVMTADARSMYELEELWGGATKVDWRKITGTPEPAPLA
jgi:ribosome-associated protein